MFSRASTASKSRPHQLATALLLLAAPGAYAQLPPTNPPPAPIPVFAQDADSLGTAVQNSDRSFAACPAVRATTPTRCITLDATKSVDPLAAPARFRWQMGDGQTREGTVLEYCYAATGRYRIQLDVVDAATGEVRQREAEYVVEITANGDLAFDGPDQVRVGEPATFRLIPERLPACVSREARYNWDFRDGLLGQGNTATHTFRRAGTFTVRLALDGTGLSADCLARQCVTRQVVVVP